MVKHPSGMANRQVKFSMRNLIKAQQKPVKNDKDRIKHMKEQMLKVPSSHKINSRSGFLVSGRNASNDQYRTSLEMEPEKAVTARDLPTED